MRAPRAARALFFSALSFAPGAFGDPPVPRALGTLALRLNPFGLLAQLDLRSSRAPSALVGHLAWRTVSVEAGVGPTVTLLGGFLTATALVTAEPGYYLALPRGSSLDAGRALHDPDDRRRGLRVGLWGQATFNLRPGRFWLYSRNTAAARARAEPEYDRTTDAVVDRELFFETADAVMYDLRIAGRRGWWLYVEHTHAWIAGLGTVTARPSAGLILEDVVPRVTLDLDVSYGVREGPLSGFGAIALVWITAP